MYEAPPGFRRRVIVSRSGRFELNVERSWTDQPPIARQGQLKSPEIKRLAEAFRGWEELDSHYPPVPDGGVYTVRYAEKQVTFGGRPNMPPVADRVRRTVEDILASRFAPGEW